MACSNCFNGCADVISDQCVKYTGADISVLGIKNGDNLLTVENKITEKIQKLMDGSGIIPKLDDNDICTLVRSFLPCCPPFDLNVVLTAFLKSICALDVRLKAVEDKLEDIELELLALNIDYIIPACLTGTPADTDTHGMVQVIMNKLCSVESDLHTNYTPTDELDELIDAHIAGQATTNKYNTRMVPWVPVPIFLIPNGAFDSNGAGVIGGPWEDIYICNGKSHAGIPDIRGRIIVGSTAMGPAPFDVEVNPGTSTNPAWAIGEKKGVNVVPLTVDNLPSHGHVGEIIINDPGHTHTYNAPVYEYKADFDDNERVWRGVTQKVSIDSAKTGLKGDEHPIAGERNVKVNVKDNGGNVAHANIQPGIGAYYIMYIPKP